MYRDAKAVLEERHGAALERAGRQRRFLGNDERARLPDALKKELVAIETRIEPAAATSSAILSAEEALEEHERLLKRARALLGRLEREERRARRDRALEKVRRRLLRKPIWQALIAIVAIAGITYYGVRINTDTNCSQSVGCRARGACSSSWRLGCEPASQQDCVRSEDCAVFGDCSLSAGQCLPLRDADCMQSEECEKGGRCTASNGRCVRPR